LSATVPPLLLDLDPLYTGLRSEAQALAEAVAPFAAEADEMSVIHPEVRSALTASGLWGLMVPAAYGGRLERIDPLAVTVVREVLMGTSAHLDALFALQGIGSYAITIGGSDAQREHWLPRVAAGDALAALALTEPATGSDLKGLRSALTPHADGYRLSGEKSFISNAGAATFYSVLARDADGLSLVLVPAESPGLTVTATPEIMAPHVLGELLLEDVPVGREAILGDAGAGMELVLATLSVFRVSVAGAAVGLAQAALEEATRHARTREQFGKPLARLGAVATMLADSWSEVEAARLLTYRAATIAKSEPARSLHYSSMAKMLATETAGRVVDRSMQIMGRFGLVRGSKMERLYRQARPMRIYEGATEVLHPGIARALVELVPAEA
jgi:acyl-CoA dehydrogenase